MYLCMCASKEGTRTSYQCYIAMATVLKKKNFYLVMSVLAKKLALVPHFLQDRVGIPALVPTFSSPGLPTLSLPQALWTSPHFLDEPCCLSPLLSFALALLPSAWQFLLIANHLFEWHFYSGETCELSLVLPLCSQCSRTMECSRVSSKHCLYADTLSTEWGTSLLNEGPLHPLYTHLATFLPLGGSLACR